LFDLTRIAASELVAQIDYHESIGSTSDRALAIASEGEDKLPLLVLAGRQTAGRGRGANRWWSTTGALTFSLVLEAPPARLPAERWPQVALTAGLATCDALLTLNPTARLGLKWPNDVYLMDRKICGILSESVPGWRDRLVIGIGVNVNNRVQSATCLPEAGGLDIASIATSLFDHDGVVHDLTTVLLAVLNEFDRCWRCLLDDGFGELAEAYRGRCVLTGRTVTIEQPGGQSLVGLCQGIDDTGALRLRTPGGEQLVTAGTVTGWDR
jgi:BirA family transcriptional regulator, biotin operon repressor / biotin---[acetyl-CoA-carboxylase] ligase